MLALLCLSVVGVVPLEQAYEDHVNGDNMVVLVGASWCGPCQTMKDKLDRLGIKYAYIDQDNDPVNASRYKKGDTIPQLISYNGRHDRPTVRRLIGLQTEAEILAAVDFPQRTKAQPKTVPYPGNLLQAATPKQQAKPKTTPTRPLAARLRPVSNLVVYYGGNSGEALRQHIVAEHAIAYSLLRNLTDYQLRLVHTHAHYGTLSAEWGPYRKGVLGSPSRRTYTPRRRRVFRYR